MKAAVKTEDTVHDAILSVKRLLMVYKYMAMPAVGAMPSIGAIYLAQVRRVEANFAAAEAAFLLQNPSYRTKNLAQRWNTWSRAWTGLAIGKVNSYFDRWVPQIEAILPPFDPANPDDADRAELRLKITTMRAAVDARLIGAATWTNPL